VADITIGTSLIVSKDNLSSTTYVSNATATMSQTGMKSTVYTLSSAVTSISTANLSAVGMAHFRNLSTDTSATSLIWVVSGASVVKFAAPRAGEPAVFRLADGVSFQATGHTAAILRVDITEG
jgi:hypothetical protein